MARETFQDRLCSQLPYSMGGKGMFCEPPPSHLGGTLEEIVASEHLLHLRQPVRPCSFQALALWIRRGLRTGQHTALGPTAMFLTAAPVDRLEAIERQINRFAPGLSRLHPRPFHLPSDCARTLESESGGRRSLWRSYESCAQLFFLRPTAVPLPHTCVWACFSVEPPRLRVAAFMEMAGFSGRLARLCDIYNRVTLVEFGLE